MFLEASKICLGLKTGAGFETECQTRRLYFHRGIPQCGYMDDGLGNHITHPPFICTSTLFYHSHCTFGSFTVKSPSRLMMVLDFR